MNLLIVVSNYPHVAHPYSGAFNERSARALTELGHEVEVLAPRPYVPRSLAVCKPRWRAYSQIAEHEVRRGVSIYRPAYLHLPRPCGVSCQDLATYLGCVRQLERRHQANRYDAILAFNLIGAGGLAWRLARRLAIPAAGWATGNDVRLPVNSAHGRAVRLTLRRLDLVLYQSAELRERARELCESVGVASHATRHIVLPRGIEAPPPMSQALRRRVRAKLGLREDQVMVLYVGRIVEAKGVFELIDAAALARQEQPNIVCVLIGAHNGFDDAGALRQHLRDRSELSRHVQLLEGCRPEKVWQYLNAADIFAFPSHSEGMPNSLLEAMAAGVPAVAYAIPPVLELDNGEGALKTVAPKNVSELARSLVALARSPEQRRLIGDKGQERVLSHYQAKASMAEAVSLLQALSQWNAISHPFRLHIPIFSVRGAQSKAGR
jgi:teichuronic acid biosynthesis glycosyltransferase TuaC